MVSRFVRIQLIAFGLIALLGIGYASFAYVGLPRLLGFGQYRVVLDLPNAGGLYSGAQVTLRGVDIGRVTALRLTATGVSADLSINDGVVVPADAAVAVQNTSAIGEQYVEFTPGPGAGPGLKAGDTIPASRVTLPTPINDLLDSVNRLAKSVPQDALRTSIDEFYNAFNGTGQNLQQFIDSSNQLLTTAQDNLEPTAALINGLEPVLDTQRRTGPDIRSYLSDLATFTGQLRTDDPALRGTIEKTPAFATEISTLFDQLRPTVPVLLANLTSVGQVLEVYLPNVEHTLVVLPALVNDVQSITYNNRGVPTAAALDIKTTVNDPPACLTGFDTPTRDPADLSAAPAPGSYCTAPGDSPQAVRGARNNPCPNNPAIRSATAAGCGLNFQSPQEAAAAAAAAQVDRFPEAGPANAKDAAATVPVGIPYDPKTGMFFAPNGDVFSLGESTRNGTIATSWKSFFLDPLQIPDSR